VNPGAGHGRRSAFALGRGGGLASLIWRCRRARPRICTARAHRNGAIEFFKPNPRIRAAPFSDAHSASSADSIRHHGVIQPRRGAAVKGARIVFRDHAGERRWRAAQIAGLHEVPIVPVDGHDSGALEIMISRTSSAMTSCDGRGAGYQSRALPTMQTDAEDIAKSSARAAPILPHECAAQATARKCQGFIVIGQLSAATRAR